MQATGRVFFRNALLSASLFRAGIEGRVQDLGCQQQATRFPSAFFLGRNMAANML